MSFARVVRTYRARLGYTQAQVGAAAGVNRGYIAAVESGRANPSLDVVERIAGSLGLVVETTFRPPSILGPRNQVDDLHWRCIGQAERRLRGHGAETAREVEIIHARSHGWIDLLAFDPRTGVLIIIEVKTWVDDLGAVERQLGWYERSAFEAARRLGWAPIRSVPWLLVLATAAADRFVRDNKDTLAINFPMRARQMMAIARGEASGGQLDRGIALIDPVSRRREWLMRSTVDGRRSPAPYLDVHQARRAMGIQAPDPRHVAPADGPEPAPDARRRRSSGTGERAPPGLPARIVTTGPPARGGRSEGALETGSGQRHALSALPCKTAT